MLLEAKDLKVELDSESGIVRAVDGVRFAIAKGQTFALVGESGCGKSMTALALMRLLPENGRITRGQTLLDGHHDLNALPESAMRAERGGRVGMIFQEPGTSLNPVLRVGEQIVETIETHTQLRGDAARAKALDWLKRVGIPNAERRIDDYPFQLSGGQKQRVMIAIALAAEPDILIADEPTTALDVTIQAQILDLLKKLQQEQGMAMLLITHDLAVVQQMAHTVALMYAGEIVELASAAEFFGKPLHPYAAKLFAALPDARRRGGELAAIRGTVPALTREFTQCRFVDRCDRAFDACKAAPPPLREIGSGHWVRCELYRDGASVHHASVSPQVVEPSPAGGRGQGEGAISPSSAPLLEVTDLKVHYPIRAGLLRRTIDHVRAVDGVSFSIQPGRTLALVGESGCGKTTTGKALLQLLRGNAHISGSVKLNGNELGALEGDALQAMRKQVQIIFQDPFASLNPRMRVAEILTEGLHALHPEVSDADARARIASITEKVGLRPDALERYPHEFSGGQRQRIAIARALAVEPKLLVCDEPTSALDVSVQAQILNLLKRLQDELGIAYMFITHNIGVVEFFAHDVAVMQAGKIVEAGPAQQILQTPQHAYTKTLLAAVPRLRA
ncbi:MAG: dipeptide ABC transporter ATP-binding protein [Burkholderiaceae bacterium]